MEPQKWLQLLITFATMLIYGEAVHAHIKTLKGPRYRREWSFKEGKPLKLATGQLYRDTTNETTHTNRAYEPIPLIHTSGRSYRSRRRPRDTRVIRVHRSAGTSWAEWGACNASCGVGFERREGGCSFGECMRRPATVEWRGCVGMQCDDKKRRGNPIVLSAVLLVTGFLGGVLLTTVFLKSSWILDQIDRIKKRNPGKSVNQTGKPTGDAGKRPPLKVPLKNKEPSYVDVRELNTNKEDNYFAITDDDDDGEDGYLIPDKKRIKSTRNYDEPASEPEYIDVIE